MITEKQQIFKYNSMSNFDRAAIIGYYRDGVRMNEIAGLYNIHIDLVTRVIHDYFNNKNKKHESIIWW
jgi:hypothetical protein